MKAKVQPLLLATATLSGALFGAGCITPAAGPGAAKSKEGALKSCGPEALIDDFEDNNNQVQVVEGRGGYMYTFVDKTGSTVWPEAGDNGGTFTPSPGGNNGSKFAANFKGQLGTAEVVFGAMGINFQDPKGPYDATKYAGIMFYAKRGADSVAKVRVKIPDKNTDPEGGVCSECFNDFGVNLNLTEQWTRYVLPFKDMKQMEGWGAPHKPHIDASTITAIQFQANTQGAAYDMWIDDVAFVCSGG
jgi:endoglucanase